jgi:hypothetical protein
MTFGFITVSEGSLPRFLTGEALGERFADADISSGAKEAAEKGMGQGANRKMGSAGAEAHPVLLALSARLKSCPVTKR